MQRSPSQSALVGWSNQARQVPDRLALLLKAHLIGLWLDTYVRTLHGTMVLRYYSTTVLWNHGTTGLWNHGTTVPWYHGAAVLVPENAGDS
jgi:hypothetical protein